VFSRNPEPVQIAAHGQHSSGQEIEAKKIRTDEYVALASRAPRAMTSSALIFFFFCLRMASWDKSADGSATRQKLRGQLDL